MEVLPGNTYKIHMTDSPNKYGSNQSGAEERKILEISRTTLDNSIN